MKIKELIAALQKFDEELEVVGGTGDMYSHEIIDGRFVNKFTDADGKEVCSIEFSGTCHELDAVVEKAHDEPEVNMKEDKYGPASFGGLPVNKYDECARNGHHYSECECPHVKKQD